MKLSNLKPGERLIVRNGAKGEQIAVVATIAKDGESARVHKWLKRGARWTDRVTVYAGDVLRFANPADFKKRGVESLAPIGRRP